MRSGWLGLRLVLMPLVAGRFMIEAPRSLLCFAQTNNNYITNIAINNLHQQQLVATRNSLPWLAPFRAATDRYC
jgi:hypothetical protein